MGAERLDSIYYDSINAKMLFNTNKNIYDLNIINNFSDNINNYFKKTNEIEYCIASPFNDLTNCAQIFNKDKSNENINVTKDLDNYTLDTSNTKCYTLINRLGSIITDQPSKFNKFMLPYIKEGRKCLLTYNNKPLLDENIENCCLNQNCQNDMSNYSNNFFTNHCDIFMENYCKYNYENEKCVNWLQQRLIYFSKSPINIFQDICSKNMNNIVCDYFSIFTRNYANGFYSSYFDNALDTYCNNNNNDSNCNCYLSYKNNTLIKELEYTIGPSTCWLKDCTINLKSQKWINTSQLLDKRNCKNIRCVISIDSLTADEYTKINLNNFCINNGETSGLEILNEEINSGLSVIKKQTWGFLFNITYFLLSIFFILFSIILFKFYKIK